MLWIYIASVLLASVGVITGGVTLNPIELGTNTTAGILLKSYHEFKNIKCKTDLLKFSLTSYEKVLTNLREAMRGEILIIKNSFMIWRLLIRKFWIYLRRLINLRKKMLKNSSPMQQILRDVSIGKEMSLSSKNKMADWVCTSIVRRVS